MFLFLFFLFASVWFMFRPQFDTPDLAMAVAAEWDAQTSSKGIEPALMPLMSLASTAIDQVRTT